MDTYAYIHKQENEMNMGQQHAIYTRQKITRVKQQKHTTIHTARKIGHTQDTHQQTKTYFQTTKNNMHVHKHTYRRKRAHSVKS